MATAPLGAKKKPDDETVIARPQVGSGIRAFGERVGDNARAGLATAKSATTNLAAKAVAPLALPLAAGGLFAQGVAGVERPKPQPVAALKPSVSTAPKADFSNVSSGAITAPQAKPVTQGVAGSAVGGGGSNPAGHVLGTFTGSNGKQTITAAGNTAMAASLPTSSGPVVTQGNNFAYATGGSPAAAAAPAPAIARPTVDLGRNESARVSQADSERRGFIGSIDEQIKALGPLNMRSKRDLLANLQQLKGNAVGQAGTLAGAAGNQALAAQAQLANTALGEQGANARAAAQEAGATGRTQMTLAKPELITDATGGINSVSNGLARPVLGEGGKPLRTVTATQEKQVERRQATLDNLSKQAAEFLPLSGQPTPEQILQARNLAAQTMGLQTATGPNGERGIIVDGELVAF